jgi:hypothetical protein
MKAVSYLFPLHSVAAIPIHVIVWALGNNYTR